MSLRTSSVLFFFFNDTATTEIYTLSLHDALPISTSQKLPPIVPHGHAIQARFDGAAGGGLTCQTHIHIRCATRRHSSLLLRPRDPAPCRADGQEDRAIDRTTSIARRRRERWSVG